ncbi:dihydropteroate synthase [Methanococcoides alaskense]|uniref:dihydropteroate synthase n=1 Tax=Methanococcoides alaskense TaxID=325778 RepID=A0AA90TYG2_9EURY|nr:dihydropteroate synthase [Methanococcoides alaskense]MDA0524562.1 dihydropteroate synthase [Methanococcoides alaskense]MDR6222250.1 dihydropteroate synthase [Methanococcoides alaskense]
MVVDVDICGLKVGDEHPVRLMGVINLSRESFYKGSVVDTDSLLDVAHKMIDDGATIIDLGARSTWPLAVPITKEVEYARLLPALELLKDNVDAVISVDTVFADIAEKAIESGADVVNDVAGFATDGGMLDVVAEHGCPAVVMAAGKLPGDPLGMDAIMQSLDDILIRSEERGIDTDQLILDPAIGKWVPEKSAMYDLETIDQFERLKVFEKPLLAAISRKSFIGDLLNKPATERLYGSLAAAAIVVQKGAHIIRTHDVAETFDVVQIAAAVRSRQPVVEENGFEVSVLDIPYPDDAALSMRNIGVTGTGSKIMKNKTVSRVLRISNITTTEALIIKQEILARGGDAALERDAVSHETEKTDVIVIGTLLQVKKLADKLECQARNLPLISKMIKDALEQESDIEYRYLRQS